MNLNLFPVMTPNKCRESGNFLASNCFAVLEVQSSRRLRKATALGGLEPQSQPKQCRACQSISVRGGHALRSADPGQAPAASPGCCSSALNQSINQNILRIKQHNKQNTSDRCKCTACINLGTSRRMHTYENRHRPPSRGHRPTARPTQRSAEPRQPRPPQMNRLVSRRYCWNERATPSRSPVPRFVPCRRMSVFVWFGSCVKSSCIISDILSYNLDLESA